MQSYLNTIVDWVWSDALVYLALLAGLYFTVLMRGVQFRYLGEMLRLLRENTPSQAGISSFQAFCMSLSGRIGVGNIAGVATAITAGGPGAVLWMNVMALLGGASAFAESTLAQIYKEKVGGQYRGGGPWYIAHGLGWAGFALFVAAAVCLSYGVLVPGIQANTIVNTFGTAFPSLPSKAVAACIVIPLGLIIFGGIKRIARVADIIVPLMATAYLLIMVIVLAAHFSELPAMFALIVKSAFGQDAVFGGMAGFAISWGVRRAVFSNVAGAGEGTYSSAAAEVSHPVKQGLVQAFSVYIDTVLVCTATALMILSTGMYNVLNPDGTILVEHLPGVKAGAAYTQAAIGSILPSLGPSFVAAAIFFFAFTCLLAYYYIAETTLSYLIERSRLSQKTILVLKAVFLGIVLYGCLEKAEVMWALGDIGFGTMCYLNLIVIVLLSKPARWALQDYEAQKRAGKNPVFQPPKHIIKNADFWQQP